MRSDAEIVQAVLGGDGAAFALLVRRYQCAVRATALAVLDDHHAAEDIEQEAFVAAYRKLATLRAGSHFGPWLLTITRRLARTTRLRQRRQIVPLEGVAEPPAEPSDGRLDEELQPLLAAVMRLPELERQAVMLRYLAGHSAQDVAEIMSRSAGSVTKRLYRARQRLRRWLEETER